MNDKERVIILELIIIIFGIIIISLRFQGLI
jgi:hypothetical protein